MARIINQRLINPIIGAANVNWAANILSMPSTPRYETKGPELIDKIKFVEVKSGNNANNWTLVNDQIDYQKKYPKLKGHIYW